MQAEITRRSSLISIALQRSIEQHVGFLDSIDNFYKQSPYFTQDDFQLFFSNELQSQRAIVTFGWASKVEVDQRQQFRISELRPPDFEKDSTNTSESTDTYYTYFPLKYLAKTRQPTALQIGVDLASLPILENAIQQAGDNNYIVAAPSLKNTAKSHFHDHRNLLIFIPAYHSSGASKLKIRIDPVIQ
ncbi:MAG: CHASE domain-containing protein [Cyanobacteria bacterium P01_D01_bin.156]